jgi:hypothetical protein
MMIEVDVFSTHLNGSEFWKVVYCSDYFHPYTKLKDVLLDLLKYGELQHETDQCGAIHRVLDDSEFIQTGNHLRAQNISE